MINMIIICSKSVHRVQVGKPEVKRPLGRTRPRWEDNIKMDRQKVGGSYGDWMDLAQWRAFVSTVMNFRGSVKCREFLDQLQNQLASQEGLCSME
jgi:hypothetical protein